MASVIPLNAVFLGILARARERTLKSTDSRVKLTNEVLQVGGWVGERWVEEKEAVRMCCCGL